MKDEKKFLVVIRSWLQGNSVTLHDDEIFMSEDYQLCVKRTKVTAEGDSEEVLLPIWGYEGFTAVLKQISKLSDDECFILGAQNVLTGMAEERAERRNRKDTNEG